MKTFFKQLLHFIANAFEESDGSTSMTRIGFFIMILVAMFFVVYQTLTLSTHTFDIPQMLSLVTTACTLKLVQKQQENNLDKLNK